MTATNERYQANQMAGLKYEDAAQIWTVEQMAAILGKEVKTVKRYKWEGIPRMFQGTLMARREYKTWLKKQMAEGLA